MPVLGAWQKSRNSLQACERAEKIRWPLPWDVRDLVRELGVEMPLPANRRTGLVILKRYIFLLRYDKAVYKERPNDQPNPTSRTIIAVNPSIVAIVTVSMCSGLL